MYTVLSALLCHAAEERPEGFSAFGAGFNKITPTSLPAFGELAALVIIARNDRASFQANEAATIVLDLVAPDGTADVMGSTSFVQLAEDGPGPISQTLLVPIRAGFSQPGLHTVQVSITGSEEALRLPLVVTTPV